MTNNDVNWQARLAANVLFVSASFFIVNFFYVSQRYDVTTYVKDHPAFSGAFILDYIIPLAYPIVFFIPVLIVEKYRERIPNIFGGMSQRMFLIFGQVLLSFIFFFALWNCMANLPGYPSLVDKDQISTAFIGYSVFTVITVGLLASGDIINLVEQAVNACIKKS